MNDTKTRRWSEELAVPTHDQIQRRAHQLWLWEGCPSGRDHEHWLVAETLLYAEYERRFLQIRKRSVAKRRKTRMGTPRPTISPVASITAKQRHHV